jgi:hypothetical protein
MSLEPEVALLFATTAGVAVLMVLAGVQKRTLEWRSRRRVCPSCGRIIHGRTCGCVS